ncbi:sensor histidine kinase [Bradyrhizobium sp.]|uniref:sensor histidine kinase n=1 Tax=Bradyrhizobium sp. TaxID=376 RepID=UPI003C43E61A
MTPPRRRVWRILFWIAVLAILVEVLALTSTFVEAARRRVGHGVSLVPDQIAAAVRLWPQLGEPQRQDVLTAMSSAGLSYRVATQAPPPVSSGLAHVREIEQAVRSRLGATDADTVVALTRARPFGAERRALNWALSNEPVSVYVQLATGQWLVAEARGDLLPRFFGLPTGFWVGVVGLLLASGVLIAILREGRAVERIARSVEAFAATGVPQPILPRGSPEIAALARHTQRMQQQVATLFDERNAMLGAIAHDIKTYVQRLKLRLDLLDDPEQLGKAGRDLAAMDAFLEDALLLAVHANPLQIKDRVDLMAVVSHEVEAARLAGNEVVLHSLGRGPFLVAGDRAALSRALSNIIGNALRYGHRAQAWVQHRQGMVEVTVDDDGPGIPPADRQTVFRAFHRGEQSRNRATGGTGLGLAIARGIIERQHGGFIEITDAPIGGARFTISIPALDAAEAQQDKGKRTVKWAPKIGTR